MPRRGKQLLCPDQVLIKFDQYGWQALCQQYGVRRVPAVTFVDGKLDAAFGRYYVLRNSIKIDIGNIVRVFNEAGEASGRQLRREVTNTLVHELRHAWQFQRFGWILPRLDYALVLGAVAEVIWRLLLWPIMRLVHFEFLPLQVASYILMATVIFVGLGRPLSWYSWVERDARKFADRFASRTEWQPLCQVTIQPSKFGP